MSEVGALPSWARVGAKVVCIDATPADSEWAPLIEEGKVYTVSEVTDTTCYNGPYRGSYGIGVVGLPEIYWAIPRFRSLVADEQREADLAQFRKLLTIREPEAA